MLEAILAHGSGGDEIAMLGGMIAAFGGGYYFLVARPLRESNDVEEDR
jgi:hypothetical protein